MCFLGFPYLRIKIFVRFRNILGVLLMLYCMRCQWLSRSSLTKCRIFYVAHAIVYYIKFSALNPYCWLHCICIIGISGAHLSYSFDYIALALSEEVLGSRPLSSTVVKSPAIGLIIMAIKAKAPEHTPEPLLISLYLMMGSVLFDSRRNHAFESQHMMVFDDGATWYPSLSGPCCSKPNWGKTNTEKYCHWWIIQGASVVDQSQRICNFGFVRGVSGVRWTYTYKYKSTRGWLVLSKILSYETTSLGESRCDRRDLKMNKPDRNSW